MGREARGLNNMRVGPLYFLDPDINLLRDPRWGRAQEVPGEDPYLTGEYGVHVVRGTQESEVDPRYLYSWPGLDLDGPTPRPPDPPVVTRILIYA